MNILIIPTIRKLYKNQIEYSVDIKLIAFLQKTFMKSKINIYHEKLKIKKIDLIIYGGGNSLKSKQFYNKKRIIINNKIFDLAIKKKIKQIGICYGAQFLADKFNLNITKTNNHVGKHKILFTFKNKNFKIKTNSFHRDAIEKNENFKQINFFGKSKDNFVEAFHIKNKKILGIMWHPERSLKFNIFDKKIFRKFYATNNFSSW